jgi:hypothetical protein
MACCGNLRKQFQVSTPKSPTSSPAPAGSQPKPPVRPGTATFQYLGRAGLTAIGAATGKRYRFSGPGASVPVDARDIHSLRAVPLLRKV